jgi:hypothetical protein
MPKGKIDLKDQEETKSVPLEDVVLDRKITIGANLSKAEEAELIETLAKNKDVFAWSASDLKGVSRDNTPLTSTQDKAKKAVAKKISKDRILAAKAEVQRLLDANIIREVKYSEWLANVVLVPKKNEKIRMCIDFTDLNKACKKDLFLLPRIDASVNKAARCKRFSPLDCFSGYHRIWLNKEDKEKTSFTTPFGIYCYTRMPKGIKNAGSTFTRMMKAVHGPQL